MYASPEIIFTRYCIDISRVNIIHTVHSDDNDTIWKWTRAGQNSSFSTRWPWPWVRCPRYWPKYSTWSLFMARRKASVPSVAGPKVNLTKDPFADEVDYIRWVPGQIDPERKEKLLKYKRVGSKVKPANVNKILSHWDNILKACEKGYEYSAIAAAIGVTKGQFNAFIYDHSNVRSELARYKLKARDLCINIILNAAKRGDWLPAAWYLERKHWQEFAKPEVSLQLLDRAEGQNEVVQTFGGKSLTEINKELRAQHGGNPEFKRVLDKIDAECAEIKSELGLAEGEDGSTEG